MADGSSVSAPLPLEKSKRFRFNAKALAATYPHCDTEPATVLNRVVDRWGAANLSYVCISREAHADGTPHLHLLIAWPKKIDVKSADVFDELTGKHGNYQSVRNLSNWHDYVKKHGDFIEHGSPPSTTQSISAGIAKRIREGASLDEVEEMNPGYVMLHLRLLKEYKSFLETKTKRTRVIRPPLVRFYCGCEIELGITRTFKQLQFFIYGPPGTGKTSLILDFINEGFEGFQLPLNNDFTGYDDDSFDFAYVDEFKGQLSLTFLNEWLQGSPMKLNTKYGGVFKRKNLPTFILSNFPPKGCYKNVSDEALEPFLVRINVINSGINTRSIF